MFDDDRKEPGNEIARSPENISWLTRVNVGYKNRFFPTLGSLVLSVSIVWVYHFQCSSATRTQYTRLTIGCNLILCHRNSPRFLPCFFFLKHKMHSRRHSKKYRRQVHVYEFTANITWSFTTFSLPLFLLMSFQSESGRICPLMMTWKKMREPS